jgi:hypothetical protein
MLIDISKNKGLTPQKIVQTSTVVHEKPKPVKSRFFINGGKLGIPYFYQCKYYKVQMFIRHLNKKIKKNNYHY